MYRIEIYRSGTWQPLSEVEFTEKSKALATGEEFVRVYGIIENGRLCRVRAVPKSTWWKREWMKRFKITSFAVLGMAVELSLAFLWGMSPPGYQVVLLGAMGLVLAMVGGTIYQIYKEEV